MPVLLALMAAIAYGTSDFLGGLVSRGVSPWRVSVVVQLASAVSTALVAAFAGGAPSAADHGWSVLAGVGAGVGVCFLFRGLGAGRMGVVAPLSAVGSAVVPVVFGLAAGERPGALVALGIMVALPGIWLVASEPEERDRGTRPDTSSGTGSGSGVLDGIVAGLGFGVMFSALGQVPAEAGFWPLGLAQATSVVVAVALAAAFGQPWRPDRPSWRVLPAGPLSAAAVVLFTLATQGGMLAVAAVVTSLYPAATILLAVVVLSERIHRAQGVGLGLCAATVALVAAGG
jgi:drug/metabolite transporter (DMT)-like permease